jgi:UDP-N-acetyl-2-amino-2-deoxyglucuronate dehydrogenase
MGKVKLGVIGCGLASDILYGPAFEYMEKGELAAVMDLNAERAKVLQERHGVKRVYTDLDGILNDGNVDGVMVLTPPQHHLAPVVAAAKAGKHIFCEKPMAPTLEGADEMIGACEAGGVKLMTVFMKRFNWSFQRVKELIEEGRLGEVFEVRARWDNVKVRGPSGEAFRMTVESGGGMIQEDGSHPFDVCRWWLGDVSEVTAHAMIAAPEHHPTEDVACVVMGHQSGAMSTLHVTGLTHATGEESYEIFGTHGTLVMRWLSHSTSTLEPALMTLYENSRTATDLTLDAPWHPSQRIREDWQYLRALEHFCECIVNDEEPQPNSADGRAVVEIVNAAYLSVMRGATVKLPLKESVDAKALFSKLHQSSPWSLEGRMWDSRYSRRR